MKLVTLLFLIVCSQTLLLAQKDTIAIYWESNNVKYIEYLSEEERIDSLGKSNVIISNSSYFDKEGMEISEEEFVERFGQSELDALIEERNEAMGRGHDIKDDYSEYIRKADEYLYTKEYKLALEHYERAKEVYSSEPYPQQQIEKLNNIMENR